MSPIYKNNITAQKMSFSINDFFSKYDQIRSFLRIWSHLLKKSLMENFTFCAVYEFPQNDIPEHRGVSKPSKTYKMESFPK